MQDLGNFKGCAYAKFYYDPYKTDWVYISVWEMVCSNAPLAAQA